MAVKQRVYGLQKFAGFKEEGADVLCSIAVIFRIAPAVNNPSKKVRGMVPKSILPEVKILDRQI
ncbi:hypothetical protein [Tychonema sp. LEGE 07203]|uniref:hypothetical protein n=1 Tax=Tychonema sp. LEGE 07203 TaxID=1828671 RepID=UPI00188135F1|nr:hypothetical protein [Tychonema sp. LEGE 07203]MBE9097678.1 hypothetical protein [Tychonema sp. LEGE 07203]